MCAIDRGTVWQLVYEKGEGGLGIVNFDHRPFGHFYEGATGRSFFKDYDFGAGREYVSKQLSGRRIRIEDSETGATVGLED